MSMAYERLVQFLNAEMRMSHIYQPVVLEVLFTQGGTASAHDIAAAILAHDESQIDHYERIVHGMPGTVLRSRGIVPRERQSYSLAVDVAEMSKDERADVVGAVTRPSPHTRSGAQGPSRHTDAVNWAHSWQRHLRREPGCSFCELGDRKFIAENPLAVLIADAFPETEGHVLAIPRRHVADYFELRQPERNAIQRLLEDGRARQQVKPSSLPCSPNSPAGW